MNDVYITLGEKRKLSITMRSVNNDFEIDGATVELYYMQNNVPVKVEDLDTYVDGRIIRATVKPEKRGLYVIKASMQILDETIIKQFNMRVS